MLILAEPSFAECGWLFAVGCLLSAWVLLDTPRPAQ
jgi:hypothetical protein